VIVSDFEYIDDLHLVRYRKGAGRLFVVSRPYACFFRLNGGPVYYSVPDGMETDFASIPKIVPRWIAEKVDVHIEAAVVHDHLCKTRPWSSRVAADIFNEAMRAAGVPAWRRQLMYRAVLYFGPQWETPSLPA